MFHSSYVEMLDNKRDRISNSIAEFLASGGTIQVLSNGLGSSNDVMSKLNNGGVIPCTNHKREAKKKRNASQYDSTRDKGTKTLRKIREAMKKGMTTQEAADYAGVTKSYAFKLISTNNLRHINPNSSKLA